jgi:hypothetical protein
LPLLLSRMSCSAIAATDHDLAKTAVCVLRQGYAKASVFDRGLWGEIQSMSEQNPRKPMPHVRPLVTISKLKEVIQDLPDDMPVYVCFEGVDTEARLVEVCEERVSSRGTVLDPRRLIIDEEE